MKHTAPQSTELNWPQLHSVSGVRCQVSGVRSFELVIWVDKNKQMPNLDRHI